MNDEEREKFHVEVAAVASKIITDLMSPDNSLGPLDGAFTLGSAAKLIAGVVHELEGVPLSEVEPEIPKALLRGFEVTQAKIVVLGQDS